MLNRLINRIFPSYETLLREKQTSHIREIDALNLQQIYIEHRIRMLQEQSEYLATALEHLTHSEP
jgi:hypothetical protein